MQNSTFTCSQVSAFNSNVVFFNAQGILQVCPSGVATNIDLEMADDNFLTGGHLRIRGANFGDFVNLQVIDKNGTFYPAGTILRQFVTNFYMSADDSEQADFDLPYPAKIISGLFIRIVYNSTGTTPVNVAMNYDLHKVLL